MAIYKHNRPIRDRGFLIYKNESVLGSYLAGLWEGDGHLSVKSEVYPKPTIGLTFHINQLPVAQKLLQIVAAGRHRTFVQAKGPGTTLQIGSIHIHSKRNACYLNIYDLEGLARFIHLVNGRLRTPKAYQIDYVIDWLNEKRGFSIKKRPVRSSGIPLAEDAWLAGFLDADGSFAVRQTLKSDQSVKKLTECQFILVQRVVYPKTGQSYYPVCQSIASFLRGDSRVALRTIAVDRGLDQYKIKISSRVSKRILRTYLDKYPLLTSKYLDYRDWCQVDDLMIQKLHYTSEGVNRITELKKRMNRSRIFFSWNHLDQF